MSVGSFGLHEDPREGRYCIPTSLCLHPFCHLFIPMQREKHLRKLWRPVIPGIHSQTQSPVVISLHCAASEGMFSQGHQIPQ